MLLKSQFEFLNFAIYVLSCTLNLSCLFLLPSLPAYSGLIEALTRLLLFELALTGVYYFAYFRVKPILFLYFFEQLYTEIYFLLAK